MPDELNLGFQRGTQCQAHEMPLTAYLNGIHRVSGYSHPAARHEWRCSEGCRIQLTDQEETRWGWQFFNKTSALLREQKERTYSFEDIVAMLESKGLEVVAEEAGVPSSFGDDGPVTRVTLRWKSLQ